MEIRVCESSAALGKSAAAYAANALRSAIDENGGARIVLSTGASQFDTLARLVSEDVDWAKVEMFHLDEYAGISDAHPASFRRYLRERFVDKLPRKLKAAHYVDGTEAGIASLTAELNAAPVDLGLIGIGENGHIAFNDPPADFDTDASYIMVKLDEVCRRQQLREGWFPTLADVPEYAVSMTVSRILKCKKIITCVPYAVKADAVYKTLKNALTNEVPATALKTHGDFTLYLDRDSAGKVIDFI